MATGDKIYLADKETLDLVKITVNNLWDINTVIKSAVDNLIQKSDSILTAVQSINSTVRQSESHSLSDLNKLTHSSPPANVGSTHVTVLSLSSPGELYYVVGQCSTTSSSRNDLHVKVIVDGTTIFQGYVYANASTTPQCLGLYSKETYTGVNGNNLHTVAARFPLSSLVNQGNSIMLNSASISNHANSNNSILEHVMSLKPIRWNRSLEVRAYSTVQASPVHCCYKLD